VYAIDNIDAIDHRARTPVPFGEHQDVAGSELVDGLLKFGTTFHSLAGGLLAEDEVDPLSAQRADLPIEVLMA
jgi:hypothetical protein